MVGLVDEERVNLTVRELTSENVPIKLAVDSTDLLEEILGERELRAEAEGVIVQVIGVLRPAMEQESVQKLVAHTMGTVDCIGQ